MSEKKPRYYSWPRKEMLVYLPSGAKKVLDVGCGAGNFGAGLKEKFNCEVWGIDISEESVREAQSKLDKAFCGSVTEKLAEFPDGYFDAIYFNDVLEHLVDPYSLLRDIARKLSPTGVVIASIPNIRHFRTLYKLVVNKDWDYEESGILDRTHLRFFTKNSMLKMFKEQNYEVLKIEGIGKTKSIRPYLYHFLSFGLVGTDTKYLQYAVVAKPKR